jgi:hypothetical protein
MNLPDIKIQTLKWDIYSSTINTARIFQNKASELSEHKIQSALQKVFDRLSMTKQNITIETLYLDIHLDSEDQADESILENIENEFRQTINEILHSDNQNLINHVDNKLIEHFIYFLKTGILPWNADQDLFNNATELLKNLLKNSDLTSIRRLKEIIRDDAIVFYRLIDYLSNTDLDYFINKFYSISKTIKDVLNECKTLLLFALPIELGENRLKLLLNGYIIKYEIKDPIVSIENILMNWLKYISENNLLSIKENKSIINFLQSKFQKTTLPEQIVGSDMLIRIFAGIPDQNINSNITTELEHNNGFISLQPFVKPDAYFINNAGIILFYPKLKSLFTYHGLMEENNFISNENRYIAARLIQFVAQRNTDFKEYNLVLNKLLCGIDLEFPVYSNLEPDIIISENEIHKFYTDCFKKWAFVRNTSLNGISDSLLLRNGKITDEQDHFILLVERKGMDVVLDSLPYPISVIHLPWMLKPIFVKW